MIKKSNSDTSLQHLQDLLSTSGSIISEFRLEPESKAYSAAKFRINNKSVVYRKARVTPKKAGQFVTIWKRNAEGITAPFDEADDLDLMIIESGDEEKSGYFIFPKAILIEKRIISAAGKDGKRGIRVYTPYDVVANKQAEKTQNWQKNYFAENDTYFRQLIKITIFILQ